MQARDGLFVSRIPLITLSDAGCDFFCILAVHFSRLLGGAFLSHIYARITSDLRESGTKAREGFGKMLAIPCPFLLFRKHELAEKLEWAWDRTPLRVDKIGCGFAKQFQDA